VKTTERNRWGAEERERRHRRERHGTAREAPRRTPKAKSELTHRKASERRPGAREAKGNPPSEEFPPDGADAAREHRSNAGEDTEPRRRGSFPRSSPRPSSRRFGCRSEPWPRVVSAPRAEQHAQAWLGGAEQSSEAGSHLTQAPRCARPFSRGPKTSARARPVPVLYVPERPGLDGRDRR